MSFTRKHNGKQYNANVIGRDPINDTAVLRISENLVRSEG